jgi:hypothetical protein
LQTLLLLVLLVLEQQPPHLLQLLLLELLLVCPLCLHRLLLMEHHPHCRLVLRRVELPPPVGPGGPAGTWAVQTATPGLQEEWGCRCQPLLLHHHHQHQHPLLGVLQAKALLLVLLLWTDPPGLTTTGLLGVFPSHSQDQD